MRDEKQDEERHRDLRCDRQDQEVIPLPDPFFHRLRVLDDQSWIDCGGEIYFPGRCATTAKVGVEGQATS